MAILEQWKQRARLLKTELYALYLACKDPRVPWYARLVAACVVGYAFSPIVLIPDPIPVLGYLDHLILVPLGISLAIRLIPLSVLDECRVKAREGVLSTYSSISMGLPVPRTMRSKIGPSAACLRRHLEAGDLLPDLEAVRTFPAIFLRA